MINLMPIWGVPLNTSGEDVSYSEYLKGKKVSIVGPAPSVIGSKQGARIDRSDVVVRTNQALPIMDDIKHDIGTRCDVIYHCMNTTPKAGGLINVEMLLSNGVTWLAAPYARRGRFHNAATAFEKDNEGRLNYHNVDNAFYDSVYKYMGTMPNTGIMAIIDLLAHDVASVYVTGFTFFKGGYHKHYRNGRSEAHTLAEMKKAGCHRIEPQIDFMQMVKNKDSRLSVDETLDSILG